MSKLSYAIAGWTCTIGEFVAGFIAVVFLASALRDGGASVLIGLIAAAATYGFHRINERQGW